MIPRFCLPALLIGALLLGAPLSAQNYLSPTIDIQGPTTFHPDIVAKANELETPLRIFQFVHDEIEYEVYYGSKKGALGALWSGRANDLDQASLLIGLLRARNYKARYVIGVIDLPMDQAMNWAGTKFPDPTHRIFYFAYCNANATAPACSASPKRFVYDPSNDSSIQLEHAWVEVESSAAYRGLEIGSSEPIWLPLDPSWKSRDYQQGISSVPIDDELPNGSCPGGQVCFGYNNYYSSIDSRLPSEIWGTQLREWLALDQAGKTLADVAYDGPVRPLGLEVLPLSLPFDPLAQPPLIHTHDLGTLEVGANPYRRRYRIEVGVRSGLAGPFYSRTLWVPDVIDERLTISFFPYNGPFATAMPTVIQRGGYLGGPYNGYPTLFDYCIANTGIEATDCYVWPVLRREGVKDILTDVPGPGLPEVYTLGQLGGATVRLDRDLVPGLKASSFAAPVDYQVAMGTQVAIALDVDAVSEPQIRHRIDKLLALRSTYNLVDEGDIDLNGNGIKRELLFDQFTPGIQPCLPLGDPDEELNETQCDMALSANFNHNDEFIGELLHLVSLRYFQRLREEASELDALDRAVEIRQPWIGIARSGPVIEYLFDHPVGVLGNTSVIDIRGIRISHIDLDEDCLANCSEVFGQREARLLTHVASALEHQVWEEIVGRPFLSMVKGIQLVRTEFPQQPLLRVDSTNESTFRAALDAFPFDPITELAKDEMEVGPYTNGGFTLTPMARAVGDAGAADVFYGQYPLGGGATRYAAAVVYNEGLLGGGVPLDYDLIAPFDLGLDDYDFNLVGADSFLAADPVSMVSGNNYLEERDLLIPTNGPPFAFGRAYNSQSDISGELGFGWTHTYEQRVEPAKQEQEFAYLPSSLQEFDDENDVEGARSDTFDTWNDGRNPVEIAGWPGLPSAFTLKATIDSRTLELGYLGAFSFEVWQGGAKIHGPIEVPASTTGVSLERFDLPASANLGLPLEIRFVSSANEFLDFDSSDRLYVARILVGFRGPAIERVELPVTPSSTPGWSSGTSQVTDTDPSTCVSPSSATSTLNYPPPTDTSGAFALEVSAAVDPSSSNPQAVIWLGADNPGNPSFLVGPNNDVGAARVRFLTTNLSQLSTVTYEANGSPKVGLCHLRRTLLRFRDQVDFVLEGGAHERFTKVGTTWVPAAGVRDQLFDVTVPQGGPGYRVVRPDGTQLRFTKALTLDAYRLTKISDAQGRSLILIYEAATSRLQTVCREGATPGECETSTPTHQLVFAYDANDFIDTITDWSGRIWDYTVEDGDLVEFRDPLAVQEGWVGIEYTYETGHVENPDLNHNLKRVTYPEDRNGSASGGVRSVEFTYFNNDKVESHTDSLGNTQTFLFNLVRLENQTTDARGFTTIYRHDTDGNLVQRRDPDGAVWDWEYDADRNVISETDPFGRVRQFSSFDAKGNPGQVVDRDGKAITLTYNPLTGAPATILDKRGNTRTVGYTSDGLPQSSSATLAGQNTLLSTSLYDPTSRRVTQTTEPLGDGTDRVRDTRFFYEEPGDTTDRDLSRVESRDETGAVIAKTEYDEYDAVGRPRFQRVDREASANDSTLVQLVTETVYNARDQVERVIRPDGTAEVAEYDKNGNVTRQFLEERRADGQLVMHGLTQLSYDVMDRVVASVDAAGGTTTYGYDLSGNRISMTDPEGHTWRTEYDAMNRPFRVQDPNGAVTETRYDVAGQVVATIDATGVETVRAYDAIGRLVDYQYGNRPHATRAVFYGPGTAYREELTDPESRVTKYEFDDLGRVFRTTDAANGQTLVAYNLLGSAQTVTDPLGKPTAFLFDTLGRTTSVTPSYGGPELLTYDQTGNVIRRRKPDLCELEQDYDAMGRLVARRTEVNNSYCDYGPIDDEFGYDARGLLVAAQNDDVGLIREYDALGRMLREIDTRFGTGVGYAYDPASHLTSKVYPDGSAVHYAYDGAGRTVGISDPFGDTTRFVYDAAGRRVQKLGTQGLRTEYGYEPGTGWLTGVTSYAQTGGVAAAFTYPSHDDVGNRLTMTETSGGATAYTYDALDRLATLDPPNEAIYPANGALTEFAYDAAGNRTDFGPKSGGGFVSPHTTYTYDAAKRLKNIKVDDTTAETFTLYDGNGNPGTWTTGSTARSLKFDALGRLVEISGGFSASYVYDPFGRRIEKTEAGTTTRYQYDGLDVVAEYSATQLVATYVFGPGIDEVLKLKRGTTLAAYHSDGLGSVVSITDGNGASLKTYRYDAFGKPIAQTGTLANAYTYTGREQDASGLYYYRARYYLPSAGRFLTPDPIGLAGGINAYAYVGSNPVNYADPFGLMAGRPFASAAPDLPSLLMADPYHPDRFDPSFRVETRSYAPFRSFAHVYPPYFGFLGDNRGPSDELGASARMHGDVLVRPSSGFVGPLSAYSDFTTPSEWPLPPLREIPEGRLEEERLDRGVKLGIHLAGSDPYYFGGAPDIDLHTIVSLSIERDMLSVDVWQFGDRFPNSDVVVRDSRGRGVIVHSFETSYGPQVGPAMLMGDNYGFMGHSSVRLPLNRWGAFR